MKLCSACNITKALDDFPFKKDGRTGKSYPTSKCRECYNSWQSQRKKVVRLKNGPDLVEKNNRLKRKYSLTLAEYQEKFSSQEGSCAICGRHQSEFPRALAVDHCHATLKNRGLLCIPCNQGLGHFRDNRELLLKAAKYIDQYQTIQVRRYTPEDYPMIKSWFLDRGMSAPLLTTLPQVGFVVPDVAAYFLYQTDSNAAYLENLCSNLNTTPEHRDAAIDLIVHEAMKAAKELGFTRCLAVTDNPTVVKRALLKGATAEPNKVLLIKLLETN